MAVQASWQTDRNSMLGIPSRYASYRGAVLAGAVLLCSLSDALAVGGAMPDDAHADRLVSLSDGRRINIVCTGQVGPTVILVAGLGLWSEDWRKVQAALSSTMRVCSWDRAGFGYSDAPVRPLTLESSERDLEIWLRGARIAPPYIVVGHSLGAIEARLFIAGNQAEIAGVVLVDPTVANQAAVMPRIAPGLAAMVNDERPLEHCLSESRSDSMSGRRGADCIDPPPSDASPELRSRWAAIAGRSSSFAGDLTLDRSLAAAARALASVERPLGDRPIIVLTAGRSPPAPALLQPEVARWTLYWRADHQALARLSPLGEERLVPHASHMIEQDNPEAVVAAIRDVARRDGSTDGKAWLGQRDR